MNKLHYWINKFLWIILQYPARLVPLKNVIVFDNFSGRGMGDDPKYIALELLNRRVPYKLYWLVRDSGNDFPKGIYPLQIGSLKFYYVSSIAKIWVDNVRGPFVNMNKRDGQYYIQTWHSTFGLKKMGKDNLKSSEKSRLIAQKDASKTDLMYTNCDFRRKKFQTTYWYNGPVLKCDIPRISAILNQSKELGVKIKKHYGILDETNILLYAPTFRGEDNNVSKYIFDFRKVIISAEKKFGKSFVLLLRFHPNLRENKIVKSIHYDDKIIQATDYPDMQELVCASDILITDFSSSMFDFAISRKPVFIYAKDYDDYISEERELYFYPHKDLPFPFSKTDDDLVKNITDFSTKNYCVSLDEFFNEIGLKDSGCGSIVLANIIENRIRHRNCSYS